MSQATRVAALMARLSDANVLIAREIIGRYPRPKSALIPLLHLCQEQDGHVTTDAMAHLAELLGVTPAEVYGTASFYEMFKFEPVGRYCVNVCTNISCQLLGGVGAARARRGAPRDQGRRHDGGRPVHPRGRRVHRRLHRGARLQVNYRFRYKVTNGDFDQLIDDLRAGRLADEIPPHGTLARVRQRVPADRWAGTGTAGPGRGGRPMTGPDERERTRSTCRAWCRRVRPSSPAASTLADGYTYDGYVRTGGYVALRKALAEMTPEQVARGGQGGRAAGPGRRRLPGGDEVGLPARPTCCPRYVVVNGDESEPGHLQGPASSWSSTRTSSSRAIVLTCYAVERRAGLPVRAGRDGARPGAPRPGPQRRLRPRPGGQGHPRHRASASTSRSRGAPAPTSSARRRRSSRASRASGACPG